MKKSLFFYCLCSLSLLLLINGQTVLAEDDSELDWSRNRINLSSAIKAGLTGKGVKIAIIDSGFKQSHPDFKDANFAEGISCINTFYNEEKKQLECVEDDETDWDDDIIGHGTFVTGILVGKKNKEEKTIGISPEATIYPIKIKHKTIENPTFEENVRSTNALTGGIYWAIDHDVDIINISQSTGDSDWKIVREAIAEAQKKGILVVAGTGNEGVYWTNFDKVGFPAAYHSVVAVGGFFENDKRCEDLSPIPIGEENNQALGECHPSAGPETDIAAPYKIISTSLSDGYREDKGTSFSGPMVTGVAALIMEQLKDQKVNYSLEQIKQLLYNTADYLPGDIDENGHNVEFGAGSVQATPIASKNPYFNTWMDEKNRNSASKQFGKLDDEIITDKDSSSFKYYINHLFGYSFKFPTYWFVDHVEPSRYVRFFFNNFKMEVTFDQQKNANKRENFIKDMIKRLPDPEKILTFEDVNGNHGVAYSYKSYEKESKLSYNVYYFINTPSGIVTFRTKSANDYTTKTNLEIEMAQVVQSFDNENDSEHVGEDFYIPFLENGLYKTRVTDSTFSIPSGKAMFGWYDEEPIDKIETYIKEIETDLNTTVGSETIESQINYPEDIVGIKKIIEKGRTPILDLDLGVRYSKYDPEYVLSYYDDAIKKWAENLKEVNGTVFVRLGSGMNGTFKSFSALRNYYTSDDNVFTRDAETYKYLYRYVVATMKKEGVTNVKFVWSPSVSSEPNISYNNYAMYYPGDDYVDWINIMGYNLDEEGDSKLFTEVFDSTYKKLRRMYPDKPMMIETSSLNRNNGKEAYIHSLFDHLSDYPNIQLVTWYNGYNDVLYADFGKSEFNITMPHATDEYLGIMLNDTNKFITKPN